MAVNGQVYPAAQLGPNFIVLRAAADHPPATGRIELTIDGETTHWAVELTDGIASGCRKTKFVEVPPGLNGHTER